MINHYLKLFFRQMIIHKGYFFINGGGLVLGITSFLLIATWILDELSYDRFYKNASCLYRVEQHITDSYGQAYLAATPTPLAGILKDRFPEIIETCRIHYMPDLLFSYDAKEFIENRIMAADPSFLKMFEFPFVFGDKERALNDINAVVLTRKASRKYFGDTNPVGKMMSLNQQNPVIVTGVIEDHPKNTHIDFELLLTIDRAIKSGGEIFPGTWHRFDEISTYALLETESSLDEINAKIENVKKEFQPKWEDKVYLRPITRIHTSPEVAYNLAPTIEMSSLYTFMGVAGFLLLIAAINYINLTTAHSSRRAREIGIKKLTGASLLQIRYQFMGESLGLGIISTLISILLLFLIIPDFNQLAGKNLAISDWILHPVFGILLITILLISILAGIYPAFILSSFMPSKVLKNSNSGSKSGHQLRKYLVVFQFTITIILISGSILFMRQLSFMKHDADVGFNRKDILVIPARMDWGQGILGPQFSAFKAELLKHTGIENVTISCQSPADMGTSFDEAWWEGKTKDQIMHVHWNTVGYDYFETMGIPIINGRSFSEDFGDAMDDYRNATFIINETAEKEMGVESAIGLEFELNGKKGPIVGVAKDFHFRSFHEKVRPMAMFILPVFNSVVLIKVNEEEIPHVVNHVKSTWKKFAQDYPIYYRFIDQEYQWMYAEDDKRNLILQIFTSLSVIISCIGLIGLVSFSVSKRIKEIGIRKVFGAPVYKIIQNQIKHFLVWILIANLLAIPVSWILMKRWLEQFAYRIDPGIEIFIISCVSTVMITLVIVLIKAIPASLTNPINTLRYE